MRSIVQFRQFLGFLLLGLCLTAAGIASVTVMGVSGVSPCSMTVDADAYRECNSASNLAYDGATQANSSYDQVSVLIQIENESGFVGSVFPFGCFAKFLAAKGGVNAAEAAATQPNRIYSARELVRRAENPRFNNAPNPNHNFPESFNEQIFSGTRTVKSPNYVEYTSPGTLNGRTGSFEIGVRPSASGRTEVIVHRFFRPDP